MKKLIAVLLSVMILFCACEKEERPQEPLENLSQTEEKPLTISVFEEAGKFGLKDSEGNVIAKAQYDKIKDENGYFELIKKDGNYIAPLCENGRWVLKEQPKKLYDIYFKKAGFVPGGPYESVGLRDWEEDGIQIFAAKDGNKYQLNYNEGKFSELLMTAEKNDSLRTEYGYTVYSYFYDSYARWFGVKNSEGEIIIPEVNNEIEFPFEDRVIGIEGTSANQALDEGHCIIYELPSGKELNSDYNYADFRKFDEGYFGVGIKTWEFWNNPKDYYETAGCCFIDKNGTPVSEVYEKIYCETNEWYIMGESFDLESKIYAQKFDGTIDEFTVKDLLIKG